MGWAVHLFFIRLPAPFLCCCFVLRIQETIVGPRLHSECEYIFFFKRCDLSLQVLSSIYKQASIFLWPVVAEMWSHGLKQWLSTWWEGRASPGELRCMQCSSVTRPRLRVGSGGEGISLEIPAYLRPFEGKQVFFFCFCVHGCCSGACSHLL